MAFCDLFKEFQPIIVDEDIYLRQHIPEKDARPFWEIYRDEDNFKYWSSFKKVGPPEWEEEREIRAEASRIKGFLRVGIAEDGVMYSFIKEDLSKI